MKLATRMMIVAAMGIPFIYSPALAGIDEQDAYYLSCVEQCVDRNMGNIDQCSGYCYPKAYGNEGYNPGPPGTIDLPKPGNPCTTNYFGSCVSPY